MAIPESQLNTWSGQGSITQSAVTYSIITNALEADDARYRSQSVDIFLQGSYGNDTNIFAESDVDIVIQLRSVFYYDLDLLASPEKELAKSSIDRLGDASYSWHDFYRDVKHALTQSFGSAVEPGPKAIKVKAGGSRRNADVLVAANFRRYRTFMSGALPRIDSGLCFFDKSGTGGRIANYPHQHSKNCTAKHQATQNRFKPMVRIFKNLRSRLIDEGLLGDSVAPSYFIEGILYNVPNHLFVNGYSDTFVNAFNWIIEADRSKLVSANEEYYLIGNSSVNWPSTNCDAFLDGIRSLWTNWR